MKKASLHSLIQSMSRTEKRYFSMWVPTEDAVYKRLFDAIEKQEAYDESKIRLHFRGEKFTRQLHVAKNYLFSLIMRSLRNYHAQGSAYGHVLDLLRDAEILFIKELYDQSESALDKAQKISLQHEYHPLVLEIMNARRRLAITRGSGQAAALQEIVTEEKKTLSQCMHLHDMWNFTANLYKNFGEKDLPDDAKLKSASAHSSIRSETLRRHIRYSWFFMHNKPKKAEGEVNALLAMLEKSPGYISEEPGPYVTALGNKISMFLGQKRWQETAELLQQMHNVPETFGLKKNSRFTLRVWLRLYNLELEYARSAGLKDRALKLVKEINAFLVAHGTAVTGTYTLLFRVQFALVQIDARDLRAALREINEIINGDFDNERADLLCCARMMNLVVHFELGNILVLRYIVDSTERFLAKKKCLGDPEKLLLALFRKLSRAHKSEYRGLFRTAAAQLKDEKFEYFDFAAWLSGF